LAIKLIADPHGSFQGLMDVVRADDILIVLGDIPDLIDWADFSGIIPDVVGKELFINKILYAMKEGPQAAVELRDELLSPDGVYFQELLERTSEQYRRFCAVLDEIGCRTYIVYGNADIPELLQMAMDGSQNAVLARGRMEIEGTIFGFVPGAIYSPFKLPAEMDDRMFGARLDELRDLDVLCTHIPPQYEAAVFDVVAGRPVEGSRTLLEYIERVRPAYLYHGHVHQPAQRELRIGDTRVINVAYYKRDRYVHVHGEDHGV
jgi:Icc-related predicted phosphoesterase